MAYFNGYEILRTEEREQLKINVGAKKVNNNLMIAIQLVHNRDWYQGSYTCPAQGDEVGYGVSGPNDGRYHYVKFLWELYAGNQVVANGQINSINVQKTIPDVKEIVSYDLSNLDISSDLRFHFYWDPNTIYNGWRGYYGLNTDGRWYWVDLSFDLDISVPLVLMQSNFVLSYNNGLSNINIKNPNFKNGNIFTSDFKNRNYEDSKSIYWHYYIPSETPVFDRSSSATITYYEDENTVYQTTTTELKYLEEPKFLYWKSNVPLNGHSVDQTKPTVIPRAGEFSNRTNENGQYIYYPTTKAKTGESIWYPGEEITSDFIGGKVTFTAVWASKKNFNNLKEKSVTIINYPDGVEADGWVSEDKRNTYSPGEKININKNISLYLTKSDKDNLVWIFTKDKKWERGKIFVYNDERWEEGKAWTFTKNNWQENNELLDFIGDDLLSTNTSKNPFIITYTFSLKDSLENVQYRIIRDGYPETEEFFPISNLTKRNGLYRCNIPVLWEEVQLEFKSSSYEKTIKNKKGSFQRYHKLLLDANNSSNEGIEKSEAILNVLSAWQKINNVEGEYVNSILTKEEQCVSWVKTENLKNYKINGEENLANLGIKDCSFQLYLVDYIGNSFVFSLEDGENINNFTFIFNGTNLNYQKIGNYYHLRLPKEQDFFNWKNEKTLAINKNNQTVNINFSYLSSLYYMLNTYLNEGDAWREFAQSLALLLKSYDAIPNWYDFQ